MNGEKSTIFAFGTESGDEWWIANHVNNATALAAFREAEPDMVDDVRDCELCITRGWWKQVGPDEEHYERCAEDDEGAEPWTLIEL